MFLIVQLFISFGVFGQNFEKFYEWFSRNSRISDRAFPHSIAFFCTHYACAAFNWLLLVTTEKLRITGFFASSPFLTDLCNKRLKPSIHCFQLRRLASLGPSFFRSGSKLVHLLAVQKFVQCRWCFRPKFREIL